MTVIDGRPCRGGTQLRNYVASRPPGSTVAMTVNRGGRELKLRVQLGERTDEAMALFTGGGLMGAQLIPVTPETAQQFGYQGLRGGLIIASIEDGSVAQENGLQVGDVLESAGGIGLSSVEQLLGIIREAKSNEQPLRMIVRRGNQRMLLVLR